MTKEEVKREAKEADVNPEVKGQLKRRQHEMAVRRMMSAVPDADVVITNPTHYAVALRYARVAAGAAGGGEGRRPRRLPDHREGPRERRRGGPAARRSRGASTPPPRWASSSRPRRSAPSPRSSPTSTARPAVSRRPPDEHRRRPRPAVARHPQPPARQQRRRDRGRRRRDRRDDDPAAPDVPAGHPDHGQHLGRARDRAGDALHHRAAPVLGVPVAAARRDALPAGAQHLEHPADPARTATPARSSPRSATSSSAATWWSA